METGLKKKKKLRGIKRTAFFVSFYFTRTGVLKYYDSTCTFKITTIFLNKPFVGEATAKASKIIVSIFDS